MITVRSPSSPSGNEMTTSVGTEIVEGSGVGTAVTTVSTLGVAAGRGAGVTTGGGGAVATGAGGGIGAIDGRSRSGGTAVSRGPVVPIVVPGKYRSRICRAVSPFSASLADPITQSPTP